MSTPMAAVDRPTPQPNPTARAVGSAACRRSFSRTSATSALAFGVAVIGMAVTALVPIVSKTIIDDVIIQDNKAARAVARHRSS